jgi:hypothetical protein
MFPLTCWKLCTNLHGVTTQTLLMVTSVRTSNIIVLSVANNLIPPYSQQVEHEKYAYQFSGILCTSYYRQFGFQVRV